MCCGCLGGSHHIPRLCRVNLGYQLSGAYLHGLHLFFSVHFFDFLKILLQSSEISATITRPIFSVKITSYLKCRRMGHYCIHLENVILEINTDLCTMKRLKPKENQAYLSFNDEDIVIIDQVQKLPENGTYYSDYVFLIICTKGKIEMTYDGRKVTLHEGELFLGVPGSVLSDYMLSPHFDCKIIAVKPSEATVPMELHKQMVNSAIYVKDHPIAKLSEDGLATFFSYYNFLTIRIKKPSHRYYNGEVRALLNAFLLYIIGTMDSEMEEMVVKAFLPNYYFSVEGWEFNSLIILQYR